MAPIQAAGEAMTITVEWLKEQNACSEGIIVFHTAGNVGFKKTIEGDDVPKGLAKSPTPGVHDGQVKEEGGR